MVAADPSAAVGNLPTSPTYLCTISPPTTTSLLLSSTQTLETANAEKVFRMQKCDDEADMQIGVAGAWEDVRLKWSKRAFNASRARPRTFDPLTPAGPSSHYQP